MHSGSLTSFKHDQSNNSEHLCCCLVSLLDICRVEWPPVFRGLLCLLFFFFNNLHLREVYTISLAQKLVDFSVLFDLLSLQDVTSLTPLSPEIISRQATINIGMEFKHAPITFVLFEHV